MYSIVFSPSAQRQLLKLPIDIQERIEATIDRIRIRPFSHVKKLVGSRFFAARSGEYRIILDIYQNELSILVVKLGKRDKIYD